MPVKTKEFVQREWTQPGRSLFKSRGDFSTAVGVLLDHTGQQIRRGPGFSAHLQHAGLTGVVGLFYDHANDRYVMIGVDAGDDLSTAYYSSAWSLSAISELTSAQNGLGGASMRNYLYHGGNLYVIDNDQEIRRCAGYSSAAAVFYNTTSDARILVPAGGRVYMLSDTGVIYRLADADDDFDVYFTPIASYHPQFAVAYRGYLCIIGTHDNGDISVYRASYPNIIALTEAARLHTAEPFQPSVGSLFALWQGHVYFSPGPVLAPNSAVYLDIYRFSGSHIEHVTRIEALQAKASTHGLLIWRGHLLNYELEDEIAIFRIFWGDGFTTLASFAIETITGPIAANLGSELVVTAKDESTNEGIHHGGNTSLQDGYIISSYLDMDSPGLQKRLQRLTVLMDSNATSFNIVLKYRADDSGDWVTAATTANSNRITADNIAATFYTMQIRVDFDDNTGNNLDLRIVAVSAIYTIQEL